MHINHDRGTVRFTEHRPQGVSLEGVSKMVGFPNNHRVFLLKMDQLWGVLGKPTILGNTHILVFLPNNQKTYQSNTLLKVWFLLEPNPPNPPKHQGTPRVLGHHALAADPVLHRPPTSHSSGHWWPPSGQTMPVMKNSGRSFWTAVLFQCTIPSHLCARPILCGNLSTCFLLGCTNQQQISRKLRRYVNL